MDLEANIQDPHSFNWIYTAQYFRYILLVHSVTGVQYGVVYFGVEYEFYTVSA